MQVIVVFSPWLMPQNLPMEVIPHYVAGTARTCDSTCYSVSKMVKLTDFLSQGKDEFPLGPVYGSPMLRSYTAFAGCPIVDEGP